MRRFSIELLRESPSAALRYDYMSIVVEPIVVSNPLFNCKQIWLNVVLLFCFFRRRVKDRYCFHHSRWIVFFSMHVRPFFIYIYEILFGAFYICTSTYVHLRSCCSLAQAYNPLARALFNPAFISCWNELYGNKIVFVESFFVDFYFCRVVLLI